MLRDLNFPVEVYLDEEGKKSLKIKLLHPWISYSYSITTSGTVTSIPREVNYMSLDKELLQLQITNAFKQRYNCDDSRFLLAHYYGEVM